MARLLVTALVAAGLALSAGCQRHFTTDPEAPASQPETGALVSNADPLAQPPKLDAPKPFEPTPPAVFQVGPIRVWHLHRPQLPLVSTTFLVPVGGASDPKERPGAAWLTADMMDEGAGARGAVELSTEVQDLGAELRTYAGADASFASMTVLKKRFDAAFGILADVVARPRFEVKEFTRVHGLWKDALKKRADDPAAVASVVGQAAVYGREASYGHPTMGWPSSADAVTLDEVKRFHAAAWRPENLILVVAGQIERAEIEAALAKHLGAWKPQGPAIAAPPPSSPRDDRPRLVVVHRPKAVQSALYVVREGVRVGAPGVAPLELVNTALGGSFTSRLNMNLREDKGWTYGARTGFTETRGVGTFIARTAVQAEFTGPALSETLKELSTMAANGPTDAEVKKARAQDRAELVQTYETVGGASGRLAQLAALGLPPGYDAQATRERAEADRADLARLAKAVDPSTATIVLVGDAATIDAQLDPVRAKLGLPEPTVWDVEARPVAAAAPPAAKAPAGR